MVETLLRRSSARLWPRLRSRASPSVRCRRRSRTCSLPGSRAGSPLMRSGVYVLTAVLTMLRRRPHRSPGASDTSIDARGRARPERSRRVIGWPRRGPARPRRKLGSRCESRRSALRSRLPPGSHRTNHVLPVLGALAEWHSTASSTRTCRTTTSTRLELQMADLYGRTD